MYAIIQTGGKQYRVAPGDVLQVEKLKGEPGETLELPAVAVAVDGEPLRAGKNLGARVEASILGTVRAPKVLVFKYKRRKHFKRLTGHRQSLTRIRIQEILV